MTLSEIQTAVKAQLDEQATIAVNENRGSSSVKVINGYSVSSR